MSCKLYFWIKISRFGVPLHITWTAWKTKEKTKRKKNREKVSERCHAGLNLSLLTLTITKKSWGISNGFDQQDNCTMFAVWSETWFIQLDLSHVKLKKKLHDQTIDSNKIISIFTEIGGNGKRASLFEPEDSSSDSCYLDRWKRGEYTESVRKSLNRKNFASFFKRNWHINKTKRE